MTKIAPCLWFDGQAEEAATLYAGIFPDTHIDKVHRAPGDYPSGKAGDVLTVEFTVLGTPFVGLNGGPHFKFDEAISFQVYTQDQAETDRYWNALIADGGSEGPCGWCKDRFGLSWQIVPQKLLDAMASPDREAAKRAMDAMLEMKKIDIATIQRAFEGEKVA
jgi:predicted 3-demethylubiquinone-9 3-methyltransferase (glyoxalase superfamily)